MNRCRFYWLFDSFIHSLTKSRVFVYELREGQPIHFGRDEHSTHTHTRSHIYKHFDFSAILSISLVDHSRARAPAVFGQQLNTDRHRAFQQNEKREEEKKQNKTKRKKSEPCFA